MKLCLLLLFFVWRANSIDEKEQNKKLKVLFDSVRGAVGGIPIASNIANMAAPIVDYYLHEEEVKVDVVGEIKKELTMLSNSLHESLKEVEVAVKMSIVREVESKASILMQYFDEIINADSPTLKNKTIGSFLKKCNDINPFDEALRMRDQILDVLRTQAEIGLYRSKKRLDKMSRKLNAILNELVILDFFRSNFANESKQERDDLIDKWDRKLKEIERKTNGLFEELLDNKYWENLDTIIENALKDKYVDNLQIKANETQEAIFDIHTKDKFCILANRLPENKRLEVFTREENMHTNKEYFVTVIRSKMAHKMTPDDFVAYRASNEQMQKDSVDICPNKEHEKYLAIALKHNVTAIWLRKRIDGNLIVRCSPGVYHIIPSECKVTIDNNLLYEKYILDVFPL